MVKPDPNIAVHLEWIGFVRPTGLVVSAPALDRAGAILARRDVEGQRLLRECAEESCFASKEAPQPWLPDFRFHDRYENDPEITTLRELHTAMDRALLDAYGRRDIPTDYEFLLDYEVDEEEWDARKRPYHYCCPNAVRDEVLARLLALNAQRAAAEGHSGAVAAPGSSRSQSSAPKSRMRGDGSMAAEPPRFREEADE